MKATLTDSQKIYVNGKENWRRLPKVYKIDNNLLSQSISGMLRLLYNAETNEFVFVPKEKTHIQLVEELLDCEEKELQFYASHLIGVSIIINDKGSIDSATVGFSSLERNIKLKHRAVDLEKAKFSVKTLVEKSDIPISNNFIIFLK